MVEAGSTTGKLPGGMKPANHRVKIQIDLGSNSGSATY
jgi:hypothetical protein